MSRQQMIAAAILESRALAARYFAGFDDSNRTRQAQNLPNHFAWTLGHLAYILNRCAEKLDAKPLPTLEFIEGGHPSGGGDSARFASKSVTMGSVPVDDPTQYPAATRCVEIFTAACERCSAAFRNATDAQLEQDTPWGATTLKLWQMGPRMVFHNGTHAGELADLRRALGLKSIFA